MGFIVTFSHMDITYFDHIYDLVTLIPQVSSFSLKVPFYFSLIHYMRENASALTSCLTQ